VKEKVVSKEVKFTYVLSDGNIADILTKPPAKEATVRCCEGMGLVPKPLLSKQGEY
jgi:hypothetical protein